MVDPTLLGRNSIRYTGEKAGNRKYKMCPDGFVPSDKGSNVKELEIIEKLEKLYEEIEVLRDKKEKP